jgi:formyltetrahydrofolate deformylase
VRKALASFEAALKACAKEIGVSAELRLERDKRVKDVALLVSSEDHCAKDILKRLRGPKARGRVGLVIGNHEILRSLAKAYKVPFYDIPSENKKRHEAEVLALLDRHHIDLIVLARYMQVLSPEFVFRYEGRIINIHPSLLPAFPGPRAYHQAHNKGVDVIGVTAHFVTTDLDEGPIICQDAARVDKNRDSVDAYIEKGRRLEAKVLAKAVDLFLADRLFLRRGKVLDSKKLHALQQKTRAFYKS